MNESTEVINELLGIIGLESGYRNASLDLLEAGESKYLRDLKLNFNSILNSKHLTGKEIALLGLSTAVNNANQPLMKFFTNLVQKHEATKEETAEAVSYASLLASNTIFYRFKALYTEGKIHADTCTYPDANYGEASNRKRVF